MNPGASNIGSNGRDVFIDVSRLLAMLFIVVGHVNIRTPYCQGWSPLLSIASSMSLNSGCVPLFFLLAGYFLKNTGSWMNWQRARDIFVSMLLWCIIGHFWFGALQQLETGRSVCISELVDAKMWSILGGWNSVGTPGSYDCWFLKVLIPLVFVSPCLMRMRDAVLMAIALLSAIASSVAPDHGIVFVFSSAFLAGMAFFVSGILLKRFVTVAQIGQWASGIMFWFVPLTILLSVCHLLWFPIFVPDSILVKVWIVVYLLCLSKLVCVMLPQFSRWFASFGTGVFFIYMLQEMLVIQCRYFFTIHPINKHVYALVPFGIFAVLMLGYWLVRRYVPWACGLLCLSPVKKNS